MFPTINNVINVLMGISGVACLLIFLVCVYKAIVGDESETFSARKRAKNSIIALILITLIFPIKGLILNYFPDDNLTIGNPETQGENGKPIFDGLKDVDCQKREVVNYEGIQYVVTDTFKEGDFSITVDIAYGLLKKFVAVEKGTEVKKLRLFSDCQGLTAGLFAEVKGYSINGKVYLISQLGETIKSRSEEVEKQIEEIMKKNQGGN